MANLNLVGQVPAELNHTFAITLMNPSASKSTPLSPKVGAFGPIGIAKGVPTVSGTFTMAVPSTGTEFDLDSLGNRPGGNTITFTMGSERYAYIGCRWSSEDMSVDNGSGNVEWSVSWTGTERIKLA